MQITLSQYAGFCDGVRRAYEMIEELMKKHETKRPVFVLGSLVHNEDVVKRVEAMGVRKIDSKDWEKFIRENHKSIGSLAITAHGMGPRVYQIAKEFNIPIIDTTCPRVVKAQRLAQSFQKRGYQIVIAGEPNHREVVGINEWANSEGHFVENEKDLENLSLNPSGKIAVISQTTQNQEFVEAAGKYLKEKYPNVETVDTLCLTTHNRQSEIKEISKKNDAVLVIGSPESANSKRLFEIAVAGNPRSYFVERVDQIKPEWFGDVESIGVSAGASTPKWIIDEVMEYLAEIK